MWEGFSVLCLSYIRRKDMTIHTDKGTCYRDLTLTIDAKQQYQREYGYDELLG